jgi:hypothetical protein
MHCRRVAAATLCAIVAGAVGCDRKGEDAKLAPASSALSASTADPASTAWHYAIGTKSTTQVDMPGLKEHIKGETGAATGTLEIVPVDLAQSRGLVRIDLSTFATHTFGDSEKDATQTKHARTWLEAVDEKTDDPMRWAEFAIRSIDELSATDVRTVAPAKDKSEDVRTVTMTVHGELLLHGHKLPKSDTVDVSFRYPAGAASSSKPTRIDIASKTPMRVVLKEHDVSPRDPAGQLLAWTTNLLSKVADTADVTVALTADPLP